MVPDMRAAVISDIHGNLPALDAVLCDVDEAGVDLILVGGDVANGPMPRETIDRLMALGDRARYVRGNGDRELVACFDGVPPDADRPEVVHRVITWCATQIDRPHRDFLDEFEQSLVVELTGLGPVLCCHATPASDMDVFTTRSPDEEVRALFSGICQRVAVCGHTHMQFERRVDGLRIVNAGSVGMAYEDRPGAYWALLGPDAELRRTDYDLEAAAALVRATGYPNAAYFADRNVLNPPSRTEALEYIDRVLGRT
jgi:putative phosphoesterase